MNQKERIETALKALKMVDDHRGYEWSEMGSQKEREIASVVTDAIAALTAPQPEASDREIARKICEALKVTQQITIFGFKRPDEMIYPFNTPENIENMTTFVATIRADERRKVIYAILSMGIIYKCKPLKRDDITAILDEGPAQ